MSSIQQIDPIDLSKKNPDAIILDVRTPLEHAVQKLALSHAHVPLDELEPLDFLKRHGLDKDSHVYILCRSGVRATRAAERFAAIGCSHIFVVTGGIEACALKNIPIDGKNTCTGNQTVSLERQVRITAGLIILAGSALALMVHHSFIWLPLCLGTALVYSGITDKCAAALVLTKAPWNKNCS